MKIHEAFLFGSETFQQKNVNIAMDKLQQYKYKINVVVV